MTRMEAGRSFLAQTSPLPSLAPSRFKTTGSCTFPATSTRRNVPASSVNSLEPRDEGRPSSLNEDTSPEFMTSDGDRPGPEQSHSLSSANRTTLSVSWTSSSNLLDEVTVVRSTKRLQRKSVRRKVTTAIEMDPYYAVSKTKLRKEVYWSREYAAIEMFLSGRQSEELLTKTEEVKLGENVQELLRLEKVKNDYESKSGRQLTLPTWAELAGLSCDTLKDRLRCGARSRETLINSNLTLVVHVAKKFKDYGLHLSDLLQAGNWGLVKSVDLFKPRSDCRFATFAYYWVRQRIQEAIRKGSTIIYLPNSLRILQRKMWGAKKACISEGNCYPTTEDIARRVGITPVALMRLQNLTRMPSSLDRLVRLGGFVATYKDTVADPRTGDLLVLYAKEQMVQHLLELVKALKPRQSRTLWLKYGLDNKRPKNLTEIAGIIGFTNERARQVHNVALKKLQESISPEEKKAYVALLTGAL